MVGTDETTELWRPLIVYQCSYSCRIRLLFKMVKRYQAIDQAFVIAESYFEFNDPIFWDGVLCVVVLCRVRPKAPLD